MNLRAFHPFAGPSRRPAVQRRRAGRLAGLAAGVLAGVAALSGLGCGTDSDYDTAVRANTVVGFDDYLRLHPDGTHAAEARAHLAVLVEDREWQRARAADNPDAYQQYLRGYPSGAHAHDALTAIADLNLAGTPGTEPTEPTAPSPAASASASPAPAPAATPGVTTPVASPAVKGPIARAPTPAAAAAPSKPAAKAVVAKATHAAPTAAAGVRIQLGAFGATSGAEAAWRRLAARYPELASRTPLIAAAKASDGRDLHRLQVGGFSHESAAAMCAALGANHDACLVVPPAGSPAN